jgi:hypothetical protein
MEASQTIIIDDDDEGAGSMDKRFIEINDPDDFLIGDVCVRPSNEGGAADAEPAEAFESSVPDHNNMIYEALEEKMEEHWKNMEKSGKDCCPRNGRRSVLGRYKRAIQNLPGKIFSLDDLPEKLKGFGAVGITQVRGS